MKDVNLALLVSLSPEERRKRLHGVAEVTRIRLLRECSEVLAAIANEGLRKQSE